MPACDGRTDGRTDGFTIAKLLGRYSGLCVQAVGSVGSGLSGRQLRARDESALEVAYGVHDDALYKSTACTFTFTFSRESKITTCLESSTTICLFTVQRLWFSDDDEGSFTDENLMMGDFRR